MSDNVPSQVSSQHPEGPARADAPRETWRAWWSRAQGDSRVTAIGVLHILALANLAVAQPIYNLISLEPMVLVVHRARPWEIVFVALALSLILPLLGGLFLAIASRLSKRLGQGVLLLLVFLFLAAIALPAWKRAILLPGTWLISLALITAALATWAYWRLPAMRLLATYAALGAVLFPAMFLLTPPATLLIFPPDAQPVAAGKAENPAPVVMLVFDEFSMAALLDGQRQIDAEKFPNFARLAQETTWYRNATSMSGYTQYALPALLTGKRPREVPASFASFPQNLFTLLANQYELTVFEPYTTLCPVEVDPSAVRHSPWLRMSRLSADLARIYRQFVLPFDIAPVTGTQHAQEYHKFTFERQRQKTKGLVRYNWAKNRVEQFEHFLEVLEPRQRPALYFGHIALPHGGYDCLPSGRHHDSRPDMEANRWGNDAWQVAQQQQQYLLQVAFVDRLLGRLVARLKETGLYDRCLLVVTSDHAVAFRPGLHTRDATPESAPDIMWIPLFIKAPGQTAGAVSDRNMESIDVLPTMVDLLRIAQPWPMDGISAADPARPARAKKSFYRTAERTLEFSGDFPEKNSTLMQQLQWFSTKGDVDALFRIGPHKEMVGQPLERYFVSPKTRHRVTIEDPAAFRNVDQRTSPWPCFFVGGVESQALAEGPLTLAVAVNGRIEAVTRTYRSLQGKNQWQALVRDDAIREGDNDVRLFIVRRLGSQVTLEPTINDPG